MHNVEQMLFMLVSGSQTVMCIINKILETNILFNMLHVDEFHLTFPLLRLVVLLIFCGSILFHQFEIEFEPCILSAQDQSNEQP